MAEDQAGERTEEATPKRREQAREKGQLPRSKDLASSVGLLGGVVALMWFGPWLGRNVVGVMHQTLVLDRDTLFDFDKLLSHLGGVLWAMFWPVFTLLLMMGLVALIGSILLGGFNFSTEAMAPKFSKLNPLNGLKRMLGLNALVELTKSLVKFLIIGGTAWGLLSGVFGKVQALAMEPVNGAIIDGLKILLWLCLALCMPYLLIGLVDAPYQLWQYNKQLRMSKEEIKEEHKSAEGNPQIKGRIRRMQMQMSARRMMAKVPEADVIITNPTHYAVALRYDQDKDAAPMLLAKGVDEVAAHIRDIGNAHNITMLRSPMLARALYYSADLDKPIPDGLFTAVAQVLAYVYQLRLWKKGRGQRPKRLPTEVPVPPQFRHW
ncbi:flagellar biosynthesis protein FlhB [Gallaecimonas kandeliae]|uniref:flagellar biosynthesis protein FlhB n=1 Tax=Gallaecimonas kandeliae TaxID=3029055 RepID=UPI0026477B99|nr:flagellar biosynthesis protein FlhB [Gallaecimonas kandeliae]WKE66752.1 flagellar biosynthesis protein FlhB [Gallaecimonas kandeliae]